MNAIETQKKTPRVTSGHVQLSEVKTEFNVREVLVARINGVLRVLQVQYVKLKSTFYGEHELAAVYRDMDDENARHFCLIPAELQSYDFLDPDLEVDYIRVHGTKEIRKIDDSSALRMDWGDHIIVTEQPTEPAA